MSLGLDFMDDANFDRNYADEVLKRFLERDYPRNGEGGLFTIHYAGCNMRTLEIWDQMNCYLNEIIREGSM